MPVDQSLLDQMPEHLRRQMQPSAAIDAKFRLQLYAMMAIAIDGHLQMEEQHIDVRHGPGRTRVYVRWAIPQSGFEWDGREAAGSDREFQIVVIGPSGEPVVSNKMRCVWFAVGHGVNEAATARAIFERANDA